MDNRPGATGIIGAEVRKPPADQGYEPVANTADAFSVFMMTEISKWTKVVKAAGIGIE